MRLALGGARGHPRAVTTLSRRAWLGAALGLVGCDPPAKQEAPAAGRPTTILFVRHAEKAGKEPTSPLTEAGQARAAALRDMLAHAGISAVYSTDFVRTKQTAAPLAEALGLEVKLYDAERPEEAATRLLGAHRGEAILVVGHRPNIPRMISSLVGGPPRDNLERYDELIVITMFDRGRAAELRLRYGAPNP